MYSILHKGCGGLFCRTNSIARMIASETFLPDGTNPLSGSIIILICDKCGHKAVNQNDFVIKQE